MRAYINHPHPLSVICLTDAVNKNYYAQMRIRITILGYVDVVINCIPFMYNIHYI
jgi:hypothetical protein